MCEEEKNNNIKVKKLNKNVHLTKLKEEENVKYNNTNNNDGNLGFTGLAGSTISFFLYLFLVFDK